MHVQFLNKKEYSFDPEVVKIEILANVTKTGIQYKQIFAYGVKEFYFIPII